MSEHKTEKLNDSVYGGSKQMIAGSGYGLLLVIGVYVGCLFTVSRITPQDASNFVQTIIIIGICVLATGINYAIAKSLNKREAVHTVFGVRLEKVVL